MLALKVVVVVEMVLICKLVVVLLLVLVREWFACVLFVYAFFCYIGCIRLSYGSNDCSTTDDT